MTLLAGPVSGERQIRELEAAYTAPGAPGHDHLVWTRASGARVWDARDRELIDFTSGVLVASIGHAHPRVADAIAEQARTLLNCYDAPHPLRGRVAAKLVQLAGPPFEAAALLTTGSEAIETAVKLARAATGRHEILSFSGGFHGKTLGSLSLTGIPSNRRGLGPLMPGTLVAPYAYCYRCPVQRRHPECGVACADQMVEVEATNGTGSLAAVIVEPYLGSGGAVVPPPDFWPRIRRFAAERGALLIMDEVQAGLGRAGSWFAFQQLGIVPDILVTAKGLGSGVPISAVLSTHAILGSLTPGSLGSTYGGNPLSCAAALATLEVMEETDAPRRARELGGSMLATMRSWVGEVPGLGEARGAGMSFGLEMVKEEGRRTPDPERALAVLYRADELGLVVLPPAGSHENVVRLAPPLLIPDEDLRRGLALLREALLTTTPTP
ncbi:MAG: aspartate aminotransferase family protein [Planctomycetes bacterium]|nr:aspartate aminotransferase family protein [Planctomycetota bacterium]